MVKWLNGFTVYAQAPTWSDKTGAQPATIKDLEVVFANIVKIAATLAGLGLFVMLVVAGFKLLTSRGDPQKSEEAKQTLTYAIIGLVVIVAGWLILKILGTVLGLNLLQFEIPVEN
jgi:hypothetical protein